MAVYRSVLELIGDTPLVEVGQLSPPGSRILVKLEGQNPGGSIKDRIALAMVDDAEARGLLSPGQRILEPSSGNTGIGLAIVCRLRGYGLTVVLPENVSPERRQLLEIFGARIIDSPGEEGSNGAVRMAERLSKELEDHLMLFQYGNQANPDAHYATTGPEIYRDCPELTHVVAGLGTSGTLMGVSRYLKERKPNVSVWAVEPPAGELVAGLRSLDEGFIPPIFDPDLLDRKMIVRPRESIEWTRRLAVDAGVFAGISSGAVMAAAVRIGEQAGASQPDEPTTVVAILPDGGWKYLSSGVWTDDLDVVVERASRIVYF